VASFRDANQAADAAEFAATIDWGDGSSSAGSISGSGGGPFWVQGCHSYADLGLHTVTTTIADDAYTVTATGAVYTYAFIDGGTFVIGDGGAAESSAATFWGGDWASTNTLSGGPAPAAFKGFAPGRSPICVGSWTASSGGSSNPPATVPSYTAVLVSSNITKHGSEIDGDSVHIALVRTDPGYGPDPGSPGTGTVVFMIC